MPGAAGRVRSSTAVRAVRQSLYTASGEHHGYWVRTLPGPGAPGPTGADEHARRCLAEADAVTAVFERTPHHALTGGRPGLVDVSTAMLDGRVPLPVLDPRTTLHLPVGAVRDPSLAAALEAQVARGRRFAVPGVDLLLGAQAPGRSRAMVVLDLAREDWSGVDAVLASFPPGRHPLVAVNVDDEQALHGCVARGFSLVHGRRPVHAQRTAGLGLLRAHAVALQVVARLADPEVSLATVEELLGADPVVTAHLLKWASSAATGWGRRVEEVREAVTAIGLTRLRAWTLMATVGALPAARDTVVHALTHARLAETVARSGATAEPAEAFSGALFASLVHAWGPEVLDPLRGTGSAPDAVLGGPTGPARLRPASAAEVVVLTSWFTGTPLPVRGPGAPQVPSGPDDAGPEDLDQLRDAYTSAVTWTHDVVAGAT